MINPAVFIREPLNFKNKFNIYPPSIKEVVTNPHYSQIVQVLTISYEDIRDELAKLEQHTDIPSPFEFLLNNCYNHESFAKIAKEAFYFFIHQEVTFMYEEKLIIIGRLDKVVQSIKSIQELIILTEEDYFEFQNIVREVIGSEPLKPPEPVNPNEDPRIARMKAKARERDRIKAKKGVQGGISLSTSMIAICCMGIGLTPLNIGEMSYASLTPLMNMLQNKEKYEVDIQSLLAGADSKKIKPKYWIRNLDEK